MNQPEHDRLLALFAHAAADAPAPGPHVAADDELLTAWRLGDLTPAEETRFHHHLSNCAACRRAVADLAELDREPERERKWPWPRPPWRSVLGTVVALAACLVLAVGYFVTPSSEARELARAEAELRDGRPDDALARLMKINPDRLKESARAERVRLLEQAAYGVVRSDVEAGRFDDAAARYTVASAAGAHSDRLEGLKVLAENHLSLRPALTGASGSLLDRGFTPRGVLPTMDVPHPRDALRRAWEAAVRANPEDPAVLLNAGEFFLSQRELPEAERLFRRVVQLDPGNAGGYIGLGMVLAAEEKFDQALPRFLRARELAPESAAVLIDLAVCYEGKGDPQSARPYWEQALARTPDPKTRACIEKHLKK